MPGDAFSGNDEPVTVEADSEDVRKLLLGDESEPGADDVVEPVLDD
jgi:hypothetical protein